MKQDMIVILDLGSTQNTVVAREIRDLGVYSEIHPHDITVEELKALENVKGIISVSYTHLSAPNASASADVDHPVQQGLVQVISVFIDTLLICSSTAMMLLVLLDEMCIRDSCFSIISEKCSRLYVMASVYFSMLP